MSVDLFQQPFVRSQEKAKYFWWSLTLITLLSAAVQSVNIYVYDVGFDEGVHLITAQLMEVNYQPYTEIFIGYPPFFLILLNLAWGWGHTIVSSKMAFIALNSLLLPVTAMIGRKLLGEKTALLGAFLMATSLTYIHNSGYIIADIPALLFGALSIFLVLIYIEKSFTDQNLPENSNGKALSNSILSRSAFLLLLAGIFFAVGMLTKFLIPFMGLFIALILAGHRIDAVKSTRAIWPGIKLFIVEMLLFLTGFIITTGLILSFYDVVSVYKSTILFRMAVRDAYGLNFIDNLMVMASFFTDNPALAIGLVASLWFYHKLPGIRLLLIWLVFTLLWLIIQIPLRIQHLVIILPPTVLLSGWGIWQFNNFIAEHFIKITLKNKTVSQLFRSILIILVVGYGISTHYLPIMAHADNITTGYIKRMFGYKQGRQQTLERIQLLTSPNDCIASDDPLFLLDANRLPPPQLADVSIASSDSNYLTTQIVIDNINKYNCQAVVITNSRFEKLTGLTNWLSQNFLLVYKGDIKIYIVKKGTTQRPAIELHQQFANGVQLTGLDLSHNPLKKGDAWFISFYWYLTKPVQHPYKVFIHVQDEQGQPLFHLDRFTFGAESPPATWPTQTTIKDTNWFTVPPALPSGQYYLFVGLYNPDTGERLALTPDNTGENAIKIGPLVVQ